MTAVLVLNDLKHYLNARTYIVLNLEEKKILIP